MIGTPTIKGSDKKGSDKADGIILLGHDNYLDYEHKLKWQLAQNIHFVICKSVSLIGSDND